MFFLPTFSLKAEGHIWDNHSTRLSKESGFLDSTSTLPRRLRQEITANSGGRNGNLLSLSTLHVNTDTNYVNSLLINMMWYNFHVLHHLTVKTYSMFKCMEVWGLWAYYTNATTCLGTWTKTGKSPKRSEWPHPSTDPAGPSVTVLSRGLSLSLGCSAPETLWLGSSDSVTPSLCSQKKPVGCFSSGMLAKKKTCSCSSAVMNLRTGHQTAAVAVV